MLTVATLVLFLFYTRLLNNNGGPTIGLVCKTVNVVLWPSLLTGTIATECYSLEGQFRHKPVKNDGKYWQSSLNQRGSYGSKIEGARPTFWGGRNPRFCPP